MFGITPETFIGTLEAAWISIPLMVESRAIGAITLTFVKPQDVSDENQAFILAVLNNVLKRSLALTMMKQNKRHEKRLKQPTEFKMNF